MLSRKAHEARNQEQIMSRRLLLWGGALVLVAGPGLFAQIPPAKPQSGQGEKPVAGVVASVTLTGCLERWSDEAAASPAGTPGKAPAGAEYVLTRVEGQVASATSAAATPAKPANDARYLLLSSPKVNFATHLNHKVQIVGTIAPQPSEGASPAESIAEPSRAETNLPAGPKSEAYRLNLVEVSSLTMVSPACGK
jgi:hypothetical protein